MKTMNVEVLKECNWNLIGGYGGYIGYLFLKKLFCAENYEGIHLDVFYALFPNLRHVEVLELTSIDIQFLDDIYELLKNTGDSKDWYIELHICLDIKDSNIFHQCDIYKSKFKSIGYETFVKEDKVFQTQKLVIKKPKEKVNKEYLRIGLEYAKQKGYI